jgi:hypothetical protein
MGLEPTPVTLSLILASLSANEIKIDAAILQTGMCPHQA